MGTGGMARLHEKEAEAALDGKPRPQTGPRGRRSSLLIILGNLLTFDKPVSTVALRLRPGPAPTGALRAAGARAVTTPFPPRAGSGLPVRILSPTQCLPLRRSLYKQGYKDGGSGGVPRLVGRVLRRRSGAGEGIGTER